MIEKTPKPLSPRFLSLLVHEYLPAFPQDGVEWQRLLALPILKQTTAADSKAMPLKEICGLTATSFNLCIETLHRQRPSPSSILCIRLALALVLTFLQHNEIFLNADEFSLFQIALDTGAQEASVDELGDFLLAFARHEVHAASWAAAAS